ncbi:MAG: indole-3-glycerol phosphate synthase TrpC [Chitinispirillaceae bacterium]
MNHILQTILEQKRSEVRRLRDLKNSFHERTDSKRSFIQPLDKRPALAIISEVKKASPSKGVICADFDPVRIAGEYQQGGASAISVLTDEKFFQGSIEYLVRVREKVSLPVLRKDFIIDELQILQTASINADAMLLIAAALENGQMKDLYQAALELDLDPLVEIHNGHELDRVMKLEPKLLGINNRDLTTFKTDIAVSLELVKHIPPEVTVVSESGIENVDQSRQLADAGIRALLVGESLMRSPDVKKLIGELSLGEME